MKNPFTEHPNQTENSQTYVEHGLFAFKNSFLVFWGGLFGMIHAIFPWCFPFATSTIVIKSFKKLVDSRRHVDELNREIPKGYLLKKHLRNK